MPENISTILRPGIELAMKKDAQHLNPESRYKRRGPLLSTYTENGLGKTLLTLVCYSHVLICGSDEVSIT
jgi:hypothetical protein